MTTSAISSGVHTPNTTTASQGVHLALYFVLAYLGTWVMFVPLILDTTLSREWFAVFFILSTFTGPTLAAIVVTLRTNGWQGVRELLGRVLRWRVHIVWYLAALFTFLVIWVVGYSIPFNGAPLAGLALLPQLHAMTFLSFMVSVALIPAIGEEIGWRGFALPRLQQRFGPVGGTLILGLLHSLWHLPAFFTPVLGPFSPMGFLAFVITGIAGTFVYTWIFNNARQSILIAILTHAAANSSSVVLGLLIGDQPPTNEFLASLVGSGWFNPILFATAAVILVIATQGRLGFKGENHDHGS